MIIKDPNGVFNISEDDGVCFPRISDALNHSAIIWDTSTGEAFSLVTDNKYVDIFVWEKKLS